MDEDADEDVTVHGDFYLGELRFAFGRVHHYLGVVACVDADAIDEVGVAERAAAKEHLVDVQRNDHLPLLQLHLPAEGIYGLVLILAFYRRSRKRLYQFSFKILTYITSII